MKGTGFGIKTIRKIWRVLQSIRGVSTPMGGISWEPEGIDDKLVAFQYP